MSATQPQITLSWANKHFPAPPAPAEAVLCETFEPQPRSASEEGPPNALYCGDNLGVLAHLLAGGAKGRFRLIYVDPPYNSGVAWARKVRRRGAAVASAAAVVGQQLQYPDTWEDADYLQFMYARLPLLRELLAKDGSLWLHCDHRHAHHLRCLLEEVFGAKNYLNTITWRSQTPRGAKVNAFFFANSAQAIHIFAKDRGAPTCWTPVKKTLVISEAQAAAEFMQDAGGYFRTSDPGTFSFESLQRLHAEGRLYAPYGGEVVLDAQARRAYCSNGGNIGVKYYLTNLGDGYHAAERGVDNIWDDIPGLGTTPGEDLGYPTQKTEALLARIVTTATLPGDWVLDPFMGSGTTLAAAQKSGRRWVGGDMNYGAVQTARRRLQAVIQASAGAVSNPQRGFELHAGPGKQDIAGLAPLQVHLSIAPIDGAGTRIRVTIEHVTWSEASEQGAPDWSLDWREAIDCIAIDPDYDGTVLRVTLADAPLKRTQLVTGAYEMPCRGPGAKVAVRLTDIWGQETLVVGDCPHPKESYGNTSIDRT
jgi:DNA modification methylase